MNNWLKLFVSLTLVVFAMVAHVPHAHAQGGDASSAAMEKLACPDFNIAKQLQKVCYDCIFPMTIFGIPIGSRAKLPNDRAAPFCVCPGRSGYPSIGFTIGWWDPRHTYEMVRTPWCMPSLGGRILTKDNLSASKFLGGYQSASSLVLPSRHGGQSTRGKHHDDTGSYYNFHWIKFPVAYLLGMVSSSVCSKGNSGIDVGFMSEFDPSWNNDSLATWTSPETKLFAGPWAYITCAADGVAATTVKPINRAFWCAGAWGQVYPYSGNLPSADSGPNEASLGAVKGVAKMHRFTLARKTYGNRAVCADQIYMVLPKQQYRFQQVFPLAEKKNHWLGASTFRWGEWRSIPARGEDYVYVGFSFNECCVTLW